jgi:hypothetical protein
MPGGTSGAGEQSRSLQGTGSATDSGRSAGSVPARLRFVAPESPDFCEARGYHGPFCNLERYAHFPGWEGMGECLLCGGSVRAVPESQLKAS